MYQLDPAGRMLPTSRELSRRAAERHAHLEALAVTAAPTRPSRRRPLRERLRVMILPAHP